LIVAEMRKSFSAEETRSDSSDSQGDLVSVTNTSCTTILRQIRRE